MSKHILALVAASFFAASALVPAQAAPVIKPYFQFKKAPLTQIPGDLSTDINGAATPSNGPSFSGGVSIGVQFEGISQYDGASFGRNFIPPDTHGAIGKSQYMETSNGSYAVFDKATGNRLSLVSDVAFWAAAGQTGANGDSRVMYNPDAQRWIVISFGGNAKDLQIAVSDTSNALGPWKSTKFEGFAGFGFGATADYPTLAIDKNAVYVGTNNFAPATAGGANSFRGTTLNVIPVDSLFNAAAPTVANMKQFVTPFAPPGSVEDRGFAIQGVNSRSNGTSGTVLAASLFNFDSLGYRVNGLNSGSALGSTTSGVTFLGEAPFTSPTPAHQPSAALPANRAIIDSLDERISASVYEVNGRIYGVHTVNPQGSAETRVHYFVLNAADFSILDEGDIGQAGYDYYQGSLAVNSKGQVVIGYNRSGLDPTTGRISVLAQLFTTTAGGDLLQYGDEILLKESLVDDYHNGSLFGQNAAGRQRWGDYSAVSLDPEDDNSFWVIGEFAREYNLPQFGHPGGTGGSRWGTWIAQINFVIPEAPSWAIIVLALGIVGAMQRRRRQRV